MWGVEGSGMDLLPNMVTDFRDNLGPGLQAAMTTRIENGLQVAKILHGYKIQGDACFRVGDFVWAASMPIA